MGLAVTIKAERGVLDPPEQCLRVHTSYVGLSHWSVAALAGLCPQVGRWLDRVGPMAALTGNLLVARPSTTVNAGGEGLGGFRVALLAGDGSQFLGVRHFSDPGVTLRAFEACVDRGLENRLVHSPSQALVGMTAEAFLVAGSLRGLCRCRLGCTGSRRSHAW